MLRTAGLLPPQGKSDCSVAKFHLGFAIRPKIDVHLKATIKRYAVTKCTNNMSPLGNKIESLDLST